MSNVAIIFAGGTGQRMNSKTKPKQFLELHGKPIIVYTLEQFEQSERIDGIIVVCVDGWIDYCWKQVKKFGLEKVISIIPGGKTGFYSRRNGVIEASKYFPYDSVALMHDGVRPLIDRKTISDAIDSVLEFGSAITVSPAQETIITIKPDDGTVGEILDRSKCEIAKAPQCFHLGDMLKIHNQAYADGVEDCIDTAFLMRMYGYKLHTVTGLPENIKITTPSDFYIFRAITEARENSQIFG
ncbi:MAG TPA: IspD/TarI family cytidylyltransferase [Methanocorpusculum sp.]|nr:IspD/TarI family cytidylyltransferase [Methanocorpusculum sp.]